MEDMCRASPVAHRHRLRIPAAGPCPGVDMYQMHVAFTPNLLASRYTVPGAPESAVPTR